MLSLYLVCALSACTTLRDSTSPPEYGLDVAALAPHVGGNKLVLEEVSAVERAHLQLIATNLVSTLVQIPGMQSGAATLQVNAPTTAYGNALVRALEDAGFGMQQVSADQGQNYVSYSKRLSETEAGLVTDYELSVGRISLRREFSVDGNLIYPSSLMTIRGSDAIRDIVLSDSIFVEQGGVNDAFISGVQFDGEPDPSLAVKTIDVREYDEIPLDRRTPQDVVFARAKQHFFEKRSERRPPQLDDYAKHRRTVLIFDDNKTRLLGSGNKQAVRLLVREFSDDDIMVIKACLDADGKNNDSLDRAFRVEQELLGFGIPSESTYIAPCARASYRHSSDTLHYRPIKS
jgi:hypothetical protein